MVALLVSIAVAAVWMGTLLPSWRQQAIREREAELAFRGESYARAIYLYRQKTGNLPPTVDILVQQHYLRKKYLDPITGKDFLIVGGVGLQSGVGGGAPGQQGGYRPTGIVGVRSTSTDMSIRIYNNQQTYSQWPFDFTLEQIRAGGGYPGARAPAGPDGRQNGRGGRGDEINPITPAGRGGRGPGVGGPGPAGGGPARGGFGR
jgi:type II secretory pathway pseudopilin PulG